MQANNFISPCLPEAWTGITEFTITDSLPPRPRKLLYTLQAAAFEKDCNQNEKPYTPTSPMPSTHQHYFHTSLIP